MDDETAMKVEQRRTDAGLKPQARVVALFREDEFLGVAVYYGTLLVLYWRKDDFLIVLLRVVQHNFSFNQISGVVNFRIIFYISLTLGLRGFRSERHS